MDELIIAALNSGHKVTLHPKDEDEDYYVEIDSPEGETPYNAGAYDKYVDEAVSKASANLIRCLSRRKDAS